MGGLAAGVASYLWERDGVQRPRFIVVEPRQADCLYQSALAGARPGDRQRRFRDGRNRVRRGVAAGMGLLEMCIDYFMLIDDEDAVQTMRGLAAGSERDVPLVAGESGAAGVAGC